MDESGKRTDQQTKLELMCLDGYSRLDSNIFYQNNQKNKIDQERMSIGMAWALSIREQDSENGI